MYLLKQDFKKNCVFIKIFNEERNLVKIMHNIVSSYQKALQILTSQGKFHISLGLERVKALLSLYDNPQDKIKCVHVAGTNGKGSTCAILASVLSQSGYKTGLYTSPHLVDYTERIKINGKDISKEDFADLILDIVQTAEKNDIPATEFEILTVLAFIYFEKEQVDFAVMETGLGGRLDATNVIESPLLTIITTIDADHVDRLGNTIEKIAFEKAGIIKSGVPVVVSKDNKGLEVIRKKADKLVLCKEKEKQPLLPYLNLKGLWQAKNLSLALKAVEILRKQGVTITEKALLSGLQNVQWTGRFQYIKDLNLILDGAHNPNAATELRSSLDFYYPDKNRIWIYSSINTKNYEEVMEILFRERDTVILTKSTSGAAVLPESLQAFLLQKNKTFKIYTTENVEQAINTYRGLITQNSIGIMAGSLYTIGDFLSYPS